MIRFWKAKPTEPEPGCRIPQVQCIKPGWKMRLAAKLWPIDEWLLVNLPAVREAIGPRGRRRVRRWFVRRKDLRDLRITFEVDPFMTFVAPRRWQLATGYLPNSGEAVCRVGFGVSPLDNEIYVDDLEVQPSLRRRGLARLLLKIVVERCSPPGKPLPIVPVKASADCVGFWDALRDDGEPGLAIGFPVRRCEMEKAAQYWAEFAECSDALSCCIRDRKAEMHAMWASPVDDRCFSDAQNMEFIEWLERLRTKLAPTVDAIRR